MNVSWIQSKWPVGKKSIKAYEENEWGSNHKIKGWQNSKKTENWKIKVEKGQSCI